MRTAVSAPWASCLTGKMTLMAVVCGLQWIWFKKIVHAKKRKDYALWGVD